MMQRLNRLQAIQDSFCVGQTCTNVETYTDKHNLFLKDGQISKIEATVLHWETNDEDAQVNDQSDRVESSCLATTNDVDLFFKTDIRSLTMLHVGQANSWSRLNLTRQCFEHLLSAGGIFSAVKDNILHIGVRQSELEIAPPCPRSRLLIEPDQTASGFEIVYGLRFIQLNGRPNGDPWSLRQFVVHNKTNYAKESSLWLFFCLPQVIRVQVDAQLQRLPHDITLHPFDIHVLLISVVIKMWRPYFVELAKDVEKYRLKVCMADLEDKDSMSLIGGSMLMVLRNLEMDIVDARLAIQATQDTLRGMQSLYATASPFEVNDSGRDETYCQQIISQTIQNHMRESDMLILKATALVQKLQSISATVTNFLDLANGQSLENLALQARQDGIEMAKLTKITNDESTKMAELTKIANSDTKAVKALSVITLVYLPITVVFNFFSTAFFQTGDGSVQLIGCWWLLFAIATPLTIVTLMAWIIWARRSTTDPDYMDIEGQEHLSGSTLGSDDLSGREKQT